jgi:RNA polymerase sigma factor (sigma-70 family)
MPHLNGSPNSSNSTGLICARWRTDARVRDRSRGRGPGSWIRLGRTDVSAVENLRAWLTTVVGRVCLDLLRTRTSRREDALDDDAVHVPDPVITRADADPESSAMLADSVGLALLVVLETLEPPERLAFVLHDVFGMAFDDIAPIVDRSPAAARQLASRARRRIQDKAPHPDADLREQRRLVDAFLAAARDGDFKGWSPCSIRISCCGRMAVRWRACRGSFEAPRPSWRKPPRSRSLACPARSCS